VEQSPVSEASSHSLISVYASFRKQNIKTAHTRHV